MTPQDQPASSDHDLLIRMDENVRNLRADFSLLNSDISKKIDDHEQRIRKIERYVWIAIGAGGAGAGGTATGANMKPRLPATVHTMLDLAGTTWSQYLATAGGGAGGGGGGGGGFNTGQAQWNYGAAGGSGGGSGGSAGAFFIAARNIVLNGTGTWLEAKGGVGGNGGNGGGANGAAGSVGGAGGGGGGGAGGSGGSGVLMYLTKTGSATEDLTGGAGGSAGTGGSASAGGGGASNGSAGNTGATGTLWEINLSTTE